MSLTSQGIENLFCPLNSSGVLLIVLVTDSNVAYWLLLVALALETLVGFSEECLSDGLFVSLDLRIAIQTILDTSE